MDRSRTYKIHVLVNPLMMDFWSIIAYSTASRTFIDSPKITVSSNEEDIRVNDDGLIGLYGAKSELGVGSGSQPIRNLVK